MTRMLLMLALMIVSPLALASCNYIGPMGYLIGGDGKVRAAHTLEATRTHVVFVDDRENLLRDRTMRRMIAKGAERTLLDANAVAKSEIISSEAVDAIVANDKWGKPMGIAQVGEAAEADVVIYATIDVFTLSADGVTLSPQAVARVKVIDSKTRKRLFPTGESPWHTVQTMVPRREGDLPRTPSAMTKEEQVLAERLGRDIAYVFVDHDVVKMENRIKGYGQ